MKKLYEYVFLGWKQTQQFQIWNHLHRISAEYGMKLTIIATPHE